MKMKRVQSKPEGRAQIHNVRFYHMKPRSIQCMAHNKIFNKLALSRNDGSIEIWDLRYAPYLERIIPSAPGGSVEGLAWGGKRLFSVGLTGELVEWDLCNLRPRRKQYLTGNVLWCIDVNRAGTLLAVGTEEGYINIMSIEYDELVYRHLFDKQEGRVHCCKFDATGDYLVTGSVGAIRIWNVETGHALHKIHVGCVDNIVWSIQVLSDFSIISGDSAGYVSVWDGHTASQVEQYKVLNADVLSVAVNEEENLLMCTGIEPMIRILAKTQIKRDEMIFHRWVKFLQRNVHDHDVKALLCVGDRILSGGLDGYLCISSASKTRSDAAKYGPFLQSPCVTLAADKKLLLLRYTNYLELWRLGSVKTKTNNDVVDEEQQNQSIKRKQLPLDSMPEKLLVIKAYNGKPIISATISPDGKWICYSTPDEIRYFCYTPANEGDGTPAEVTRIKDLPEQFAAATQLQFTQDSKRLLLVNRQTKKLLIFALVKDVLDLVETIEYEKYLKDNVTHLKISHCCTYIVLADADHTVATWALEKGKHYKYHLNLPRYTAATTALALQETLPRLVIAYADGKIIEYDLEDRCFTCSTNEYHVESSVTHCTSNIVLDAQNPSIYILQNDTHLFVLEKISSAVAEDEQNEEVNHDDSGHNLRSTPRKKTVISKKPKTTTSCAEEKISVLRLKLKLNYEHLLHLCRLNANELIAVGLNPITLIEQLPYAYRQKKFGIS